MPSGAPQKRIKFPTNRANRVLPARDADMDVPGLVPAAGARGPPSGRSQLLEGREHHELHLSSGNGHPERDFLLCLRERDTPPVSSEVRASCALRALRKHERQQSKVSGPTHSALGRHMFFVTPRSMCEQAVRPAFERAWVPTDRLC